MCSVTTDAAQVVQVDDRSFVTLHIAGELDLMNAGRLHDALCKAATANKDVVLDLSGVVFMDVVSYELIMAARARLRYAGRRMTLLNTPPNVERIIAVVEREVRRHLPAPRRTVQEV